MLDKFKQIIAILRQHLGMIISIFIHIGLFILLLVSIPQCERKNPPEVIISIDLLPIKKATNVENKQAMQPDPKKEEKPVEKPKPIEKSEPKLEPKPEPTPVAKPKEKLKPTPKPKEKAPPKKEVAKKKKPTKAKVSEYDALLKTLEDTVQKNDKKEKAAKNTSKGANDLTSPLSLSVKDSIKKQIEQCWNPPAGNKDAGKLKILLNISFNSDGVVASVKIVDSIRYNNDGLYKVAADAAIRAVHKCSPLQDLPVAQYSSWQNLEMNFDPSSLIY